MSSTAFAQVKIRLGKVRGPSWSRVRAALQVALTDRTEVQLVRSGESGRIGGRVRSSRGLLIAELSLLDASGEVRARERFEGRGGPALAGAIKAELWAKMGAAIQSLPEPGPAPAPPVADLPAGEAPAKPPPAARPSEKRRRRGGRPRAAPAAPTPAPSAKPAAAVEKRTEAPKEDHGRRYLAREAFRFSFGTGLFTRELSWVDNIRDPPLAGYSLGAAPAFRVGAEWYPGAHFEPGPAGWVGLEAEVELPFAVQSNREGVTFPTAASAWRLGLRGRLPLDLFEAHLGLGLAERRFHLEVADGGFTIPDLPEVRYQTLSVRLGGLLRIVDRVDVSFRAGWGFMLDSGEIGRSTWFPRSSSHTASLGGGVNVHIAKGVGAFGRFDWQGAFFDLKPEPEDRVIAGGASDNYYLGTIGLSFSATGGG